ncbi:MAG TPA: GlsB/YeaQ/YmgE family stress response membrane protein [Candidatus Baltobacteraceae bacterium]
MNILAWLLVGLIAGSLARRFPGEAPRGEWSDIIIGVAGAMAGGLVFSAFGLPGFSSVSIYSMLVAFMTALIVLLIVRVFVGRRTA